MSFSLLAVKMAMVSRTLKVEEMRGRRERDDMNTGLTLNKNIIG